MWAAFPALLWPACGPFNHGSSARHPRSPGPHERVARVPESVASSPRNRYFRKEQASHHDALEPKVRLSTTLVCSAGHDLVRRVLDLGFHVESIASTMSAVPMIDIGLVR